MRRRPGPLGRSSGVFRPDIVPEAVGGRGRSVRGIIVEKYEWVPWDRGNREPEGTE